MRRDLRRKLWSLRAGVIRRETLREAVDEACSGLIAERFDRAPPLRTSASIVLRTLDRFERAVGDARHGAREGREREAVRAVESAESALAEAWRLSGALQSWERVRADWTRWTERFGLAAASGLATIREGERLLRVARRFLDAGEARKARFVARRCRALLERLTARDRSLERRRELLGRLRGLQREGSPTAAALAGSIDRLVSEGHLETADRLLDDWEMRPEGSRLFRRASREALGRILATGREARTLAGGLELVATPEDTDETDQRTDRAASAARPSRKGA